jgi:CelD/BcsL family acetyltransferase involved in cellulose biosynthesis
LEVSYTRSFDAIAAAEWRRLAERTGHVFATQEWLETWWRHHGRRPVLLGVARLDGQAAAVVPLEVWRASGMPVLRFLGHGPSDCLGPVCARAPDLVTAHAVAETVAAIPVRRFVLVAELVAADQGFADLTGATPLYRDSSPVLALGHASWDEFLAARGRNFRQQARRYPRKLAELGPVGYRLADDPGRLDHDLDILFDLHRRRWSGTQTAFTAAEAFHREFAAIALANGWLRLWFLEIGGRTVAALYGFRFAGAESAYQAGRDPGLERNVPAGFVLLAHAVRSALADGVSEFRLLRGGAAYKERFATSDPGLETYGLARGTAAALVLRTALAARGRSLGLRRLLDRS